VLARLVITAVTTARHSSRPATRLEAKSHQQGVRVVDPLSCIGSTNVLSAPFVTPWSGQCDNLGAGEVTVLDLEDTEGSMRLASFVVGEPGLKIRKLPSAACSGICE
jgi:hypothetical protein